MATPQTPKVTDPRVTAEIARRERILNGEDVQPKKKNSHGRRVRPGRGKQGQNDAQQAHLTTRDHANRRHGNFGPTGGRYRNNDPRSHTTIEQPTENQLQQAVPAFAPLEPSRMTALGRPQLPITPDDTPQKPSGNAIESTGSASQLLVTPNISLPKATSNNGDGYSGQLNSGNGGLGGSRWSNAKGEHGHFGSLTDARGEKLEKLETKPTIKNDTPPLVKEHVAAGRAESNNVEVKSKLLEPVGFEAVGDFVTSEFDEKDQAQLHLQDTLTQDLKSANSDRLALKLALETMEQQNELMKNRLALAEESAHAEKGRQSEILRELNLKLNSDSQAFERRIAFAMDTANSAQQQLQALEQRCQETEETLVLERGRAQGLSNVNGDLIKANEGLENRLIAFQKVSDLDQRELKSTAEKLDNMNNAWATLYEQNRGLQDGLIDYNAIVRERNRLVADLEQSRRDTIASRNLVNDLESRVQEATYRIEFCTRETGDLKAELTSIMEQLKSEHAAHRATKQQLAETRARQDILGPRFAVCQEALIASFSEEDNLRAQAAELTKLAEEQKADIQKLADGLEKEKEKDVPANLPVVEPAKKKKKNKQQRNRKFDPLKEAKKLEEAKRLEEEGKAASMALVLYRSHPSWFSAPIEPTFSLSLAFEVTFRPLDAFSGTRDVDLMPESAKDNMALVLHQISNLGAKEYDGGQSSVDSHVRYTIDDQVFNHDKFERTIAYLARRYREESLNITSGDSKSGEEKNTIQPKPTHSKSIFSKASKYTKVAANLVFVGFVGIMMLCSHWFTMADGINKANYTSAALSCEVFGSDLSIIETTCPWQPPKPSALTTFASPSLMEFKPTFPELFWVESGDSSGNCSSSDKGAYQQTIDEDTCEAPREISNRRIAIGITVTVVVPSVVVGAIAIGFGWI